jgi:hypothetical protein
MITSKESIGHFTGETLKKNIISVIFSPPPVTLQLFGYPSTLPKDYKKKKKRKKEAMCQCSNKSRPHSKHIGEESSWEKILRVDGSIRM